MRRFFEDHGLGLLVVAFMLVSLATSIAMQAEGKDIATNVFGDSFGAAIVIFGTKRLRERGSAESK